MKETDKRSYRVCIKMHRTCGEPDVNKISEATQCFFLLYLCHPYAIRMGGFLVFLLFVCLFVCLFYILSLAFSE